MIPAETIQKAIYLVRSQKVMLDRDLAAMYGVPTKALKQAVRRNATRFPIDFMFVLTRGELADWRSQFVTSNSDRMGPHQEGHGEGEIQMAPVTRDQKQ